MNLYILIFITAEKMPPKIFLAHLVRARELAKQKKIERRDDTTNVVDYKKR